MQDYRLPANGTQCKDVMRTLLLRSLLGMEGYNAKVRITIEFA